MKIKNEFILIRKNPYIRLPLGYKCICKEYETI